MRRGYQTTLFYTKPIERNIKMKKIMLTILAAAFCCGMGYAEDAAPAPQTPCVKKCCAKKAECPEKKGCCPKKAECPAKKGCCPKKAECPAKKDCCPKKD